MISINGKTLGTDNIFSGGELNIKLPKLDLKEGDKVNIDCRGTDPLNLFKIGLIVNAIRNNYAYLNPSIHLNIPYFPYARQDRVCNFGEAYGLEYVMGFLHSLELYSVTTTDVHSEVFNIIKKDRGYKELSNRPFMYTVDYESGVYPMLKSTHIVQILPDEGIQVRYSRARSMYYIYGSDVPAIFKQVSDWYNKQPGPITCDKVRENGRIQHTLLKVPEDTHNAIRNFNVEFLITDDICDGGATFISVVEKLKETFPDLFARGKVDITLFVTHGIFRYGTADLYDAGITRIITTDSIPQGDFIHKGEFHVLKI